MRTLLLFLFLIPVISFGQNKRFVFFSDYQLDKTYNGSKKEGHRKATITFSDPKLITVEGTDFEKLPKGYMTFKFEGLDQDKEEIIFIKRSNGLDIYAITNTQTGNDIIYVSKHTHKVGNKTYEYTIMYGKTEENDMWAKPKYYTTFHCNLTK